MRKLLLAICLLLALPTLASAQSQTAAFSGAAAGPLQATARFASSPASLQASPSYSSSLAGQALLSDSPARLRFVEDAAAASAVSADRTAARINRPFSALAASFKVGINGVGFDFATPLAPRLNLRGGAQFFGHSANFNDSGLQFTGDITLQNIQASVDIFPFRHSSFHLSPGITLHNDNHYTAYIAVPGGQTFSLGDSGTETSDPSDPISGYTHLKLGSTIAPRFTVGWGNMLPRTGSHFSFPFEAGFQYISAPSFILTLVGNSCDSSGCGDVNSKDGPTNIQQEVQQLNQEISGLRFFPIVSVGVSYKIGRTAPR